MRCNIVSVLQSNETFKSLVRQQLGTDQYHKRNRFIREEGGLAYQGRLLYVPPKLRHHVMTEAHKSCYGGHLGVDKTCASIKKRFYWPHMRYTIRRFIGRCTACARAKPRAHKAYGEMQPIEPPERPWQQITMDLITALPETTSGKDSILVFVDRLSKTMRCVPWTKKLGAQATAKLFKETVFRFHGLPEVIIADRDPRWNSLFWRNVVQSLGTKTRLFNSLPSTDRRLNRESQHNI